MVDNNVDSCGKPYTKESHTFKLRDFFDEKELFVTRPPYQRKNVWPPSKKTNADRQFSVGIIYPIFLTRSP
jgi:hypothetical protein